MPSRKWVRRQLLKRRGFRLLTCAPALLSTTTERFGFCVWSHRKCLIKWVRLFGSSWPGVVTFFWLSGFCLSRRSVLRRRLVLPAGPPPPQSTPPLSPIFNINMSSLRWPLTPLQDIQERLRIIELCSRDQHFADFVRQTQVWVISFLSVKSTRNQLRVWRLFRTNSYSWSYNTTLIVRTLIRSSLCLFRGSN